MSRKAILVTGGAGFIGSNIVARLARDRSRDVVVCDWLGQADEGKWRNIAKHPIGDFCAPDQMFAWLDRHREAVELVIHMGAVSSTTETDADLIVQSNFVLSRDLFRWCAEEGRRFIYASSAATYGDGGLGFDDDVSLEALTALRPLNAYGWSKAQFDIYVARQAASGAAPPQWAGLKFFNVYGPNEAHKGSMKSVAAQIWPDVARGGPVKLFKSYRPDYQDGGQLRDFVYVRDAVDVIEWLANRPDVSGVFNLGAGRARSFRDMADAVFKAAGKVPRIDYVPMPPDLQERYQYFTEAKLNRLRAAGYEGQFTSLEDGVGDYVKGYLATPDPYI
ncbi:MAG TPA: ADP-glyceromanno-heptose 6-epimerase [Caulobacteraceae bacterium]|nr:ADP-glyceromanno-heptose 6-epimerase [Caulobacteraceae bacterium]